MKGKKKTIEEFITEAIEVHSDKYDYSKTAYNGYHKELCIVCPTHGEFWLTPHQHVYEKRGCPSCKINMHKKSSKMWTQDQFLNVMKEVHGNSIDFSNAIYIGTDKTVKCKCNICGNTWLAKPSKLKIGHGCPKCGLIKNGKNRQTTKEKLIERTKELFGDYDFSNVPNRFTQKEKIIVGCPKHGFYKTTADNLIHGHGCLKCAQNKLSKSFSWDVKKFVDEAEKVHDKKYSYVNSIYNGIDTPIEIICSKHGSFYQTPYCHIHQKHGCPICKESKLENEVKSYLEENGIEFIQGKRFDWLKRQHLDFYLPQCNIGIECQGEQHYKPTSFNFSKDESVLKKNFEVQQERDERKKRLCEENGLKLLYFTQYKGIKENSKDTFKDKENLIETIKKCSYH